MKRYRVLSFDFDSSATLLSMEIREDWDEKVKEQHRKNKEQIKKELIIKYGIHDSENKLKNLIDIGSKPLSIIAFHNKFLEQIRQSFVISSYYPALTSACSLGERMLNHLILALRDDFKTAHEYKKVFRKDSFDDWEQVISILESWRVLLPEVAKEFREFAQIRNRAIHFNPIVDENDRSLALEAIKKLTNIISMQFGAFGKQPWFIPGIRGARYLKKEAETDPFIRRIYIPNCVLVGPNHKLDFVNNRFIVKDPNKYEEHDISDAEYRELLNNQRKS